MKKYIFISFFFTLLACNAFAGSTSLTTYYPAPTAAYNTIKLTTNSSASCTGTNNGTIFVDSTGTLNVCINGLATVYPQESFNTFCSYDPTSPSDPNGTTTCANFLANPCPTGFVQVWVGSTSGTGYDQFDLSPHTSILSIVCSTNLNTCTSTPVNAYCTTSICAYYSPTTATSLVCGTTGTELCATQTQPQCGGTSVVGTPTSMHGTATCRYDLACGVTCTNPTPCPNSSGACSAMSTGTDAAGTTYYYCPGYT